MKFATRDIRDLSSVRHFLILAFILVFIRTPETFAQTALDPKIIKVTADCVEEDNPLMYTENKRCVRKALKGLAQRACAIHSKSLSVNPRVSSSCIHQNGRYICTGEAQAVCVDTKGPDGELISLKDEN